MLPTTRYNLIVENRTVQFYKKHIIHAAAVPGPGRAWRTAGFVFVLERTKEIKRLECLDTLCNSRREARDHALKLCMEWIDGHISP